MRARVDAHRIAYAAGSFTVAVRNRAFAVEQLRGAAGVLPVGRGLDVRTWARLLLGQSLVRLERMQGGGQQQLPPRYWVQGARARRKRGRHGACAARARFRFWVVCVGNLFWSVRRRPAITDRRLRICAIHGGVARSSACAPAHRAAHAVPARGSFHPRRRYLASPGWGPRIHRPSGPPAGTRGAPSPPPGPGRGVLISGSSHARGSRHGSRAPGDQDRA